MGLLLSSGLHLSHGCEHSLWLLHVFYPVQTFTGFYTKDRVSGVHTRGSPSPPLPLFSKLKCVNLCSDLSSLTATRRLRRCRGLLCIQQHRLAGTLSLLTASIIHSTPALDSLRTIRTGRTILFLVEACQAPSAEAGLAWGPPHTTLAVMNILRTLGNT